MTEEVLTVDVERDDLSKYVELVARRRELEREIKSLKQEATALESRLLDVFGARGIQRITLKNHTVYVHRQLWASAANGDYERACAALRAAGLDDYIQERFHSQSLSALYREWDREAEAPPPELDGAIHVEERYALRVRKDS